MRERRQRQKKNTLVYLYQRYSVSYSTPPRRILHPSFSWRFQGFTREFLKGGAGTSDDLLHEIRDAVEELSFGKQVGVC